MILQDIAHLIQDYMELPEGVVYLKGQKFNKPKNDEFRISIGFMNGTQKAFGVSSRTVNASTTLAEEIGVNKSAQVVIDIEGRSDYVLTRKDEIILAVNSSISKQDQIAKGYLISRHPTSMNDLSGLDGAAIPYRFQLIFNVQYFSSITKTIDFYNIFAIGTLLTEG